jgi:hypothetical protein
VRIPDSIFFSSTPTAQKNEKRQAQKRKHQISSSFSSIFSLYLCKAAGYSAQTNAIMFRTLVSMSMVLVLMVWVVRVWVLVSVSVWVSVLMGVL